MSIQPSFSSKKVTILQKHDDNMVIVTTIRSAITKVRHFVSIQY